MRVLMVLADTDRTDASLSAFDLHQALAAAGHDVRTVALGPGRRGGLDHVLPVLGPSVGSPATAFQLRREQRWSDVAVTFGLDATVVRGRARLGHRRSIAALVGPVTSPDRAGRRALRSVGAVVAAGDEACDGLRDVLDASIPVARVDLPMAPVDAAGLTLRRAAARRQLALAETGPLLWWADPGSPPPPALGEAATRRRWPLLATGEVDDELLMAAADAAVSPHGPSHGVPRELLRGATHGHALVAPASVDDGRLVSSDTGVPMPEPAGDREPQWDTLLDALADPAGRARMGQGARVAVAAHHAPRIVVPGWEAVLHGVLGDPDGTGAPQGPVSP